MKKKTTIVGLICFVIFLVTSSADQYPIPDKSTLKKDEVWVCDQWKWVGAPIEGKVVCINWVKKDCSDRLHKQICKLGNQP